MAELMWKYLQRYLWRHLLGVVVSQMEPNLCHSKNPKQTKRLRWKQNQYLWLFACLYRYRQRNHY